LIVISLRVNGERHSVDIDPDTPLLWVLRDTLGLTGTKYGCGIAYCGACTVHLDGQATRSCSIAVGQVGEAGSPPSRASIRRPAEPCRRRGRRSTWCSAATASPAR
jgi:hypothetical protein